MALYEKGVGDAALETVAERLSAALPKHITIGRLAGDEFAVIVNDLRPDETGIVATSELAQKLLGLCLVQYPLPVQDRWC